MATKKRLVPAFLLAAAMAVALVFTVLPELPKQTLATDSAASTVAVYRVYNPDNGEHLYTLDANEVKVLTTKHGWQDEGTGWYAPADGTAVYRLYNNALLNHLYTTDENEVKTLLKDSNWTIDNNGEPVFYSGGSVGIYRLYNRGLQGQHLLTTDANEYKVLPSYGWTQEGTALYAATLGTHSHSYTETVTTAATCTTAGIMTYTCSCGDTYTKPIAAAGHAYDDGVVTTEATCAEEGEITYTCKNCGGTYTEAIAATGHDYDDGVVTTEAACTDTGVMTYTCKNCGSTYTETIAATGHTYDEGVVTAEATCGAEGEITYTCTVCGDTYTEPIPATGEHLSYEPVYTTVEVPVYSQLGYYVCGLLVNGERCGGTHYYTWEDLVAHQIETHDGCGIFSNHTESYLSDTVILECVDHYECTVCGASKSDGCEHEWEAVYTTVEIEEPVYEGRQVCNMCGAYFEEISGSDPLSLHIINVHNGAASYSARTIQTGTTTTEQEVIAYYQCSKCEATKTE